MHPRTFSGYTGFSLTTAERARLTHLARVFGFATLDALAADLFRIGLATVDTCWTTTTRFEQFLGTRARVQQPRMAKASLRVMTRRSEAR